MDDDAVLIAEPRDLVHGSLFKSEPEEIDIYLGELALGALQCLDELLSKKEIRLLEVLDLRQKCHRLVNLIKKVQSNTLQLEDMFVGLTEVEKRIASALRRRDEFPDGFNSEADNLRIQIIRASNDAMESDHNTEVLTYQIALLEEEKKLLIKEAAAYPSTEALILQRKGVERAIDTEIVEQKKYSLESRRLHRQLNNATECRDQLTKDLAQFQKSLNLQMTEFNTIHLKSQEVMQEIKRLEWDLSDLKQISRTLEEKIKELTETQSTLLQSKASIDAETNDLTMKTKNLQEYLSNVIEKLSIVKHKNQELSDEGNKLSETISIMKVDLSRMVEDKKRCLESTNQAVKKGAVMRKLVRQGEKKIKHLEEAIEYLEGTAKVQAADLELMKRTASKRDVKESKRLRTQISQMTEALLAQNDFADHEKEEIRGVMKDTTKLLTEMDKQRQNMTDLRRLVDAKSFEASQKKRYLRKAHLHYTQVRRDIKLQQFHLNDYRKTLVSLQRQVQNLGKFYKAISVERNEFLTMINLAQQKKLMIEEKCYFYTNEMTILQSSLSNKQDQMDEIRKRMEGIRKERIGIRSELSKQTQMNQQLESHIRRFSTNLQRLNRDLVDEKAQIGRLQSECKAAVQKRNGVKHQLEDIQLKVGRNKENLEELQRKSKKARDALSAKNRELALLLHTSQAEERTVEVIRSRVTENEVVERELSNIDHQISAAREKLLHLEDLADNPTGGNSTNRLRFLKGTDPSLKQLLKGEKHLISAIAKKETELRESNEIFTTVDNLVTQLDATMKERSERTLKLAKDVNASYRINHLKETEMKAACAELRMKILHSNVLKRDIEKLKTKKSEDCQLLKRRRKRDPIRLLKDKSDLAFYTSEVISQLSIHSIKKFVAEKN